MTTPPPTTWRKSSRSTDASNCVEVSYTNTVDVRDSKNPTGPTLTLPTPTWSTFVSALP
jgi:Domain of unknown function (DUF397)